MIILRMIEFGVKTEQHVLISYTNEDCSCSLIFISSLSHLQRKLIQLISESGLKAVQVLQVFSLQHLTKGRRQNGR